MIQNNSRHLAKYVWLVCYGCISVEIDEKVRYYRICTQTKIPKPMVQNIIDTQIFGRFKDVLRSHFQYRKCDDLQKVIDDTVYYFNYIRPVRKLKRKPPVQYRLEQVA